MPHTLLIGLRQLDCFQTVLRVDLSSFVWPFSLTANEEKKIQIRERYPGYVELFFGVKASRDHKGSTADDPKNQNKTWKQWTDWGWETGGEWGTGDSNQTQVETIRATKARDKDRKGKQKRDNQQKIIYQRKRGNNQKTNNRHRDM